MITTEYRINGEINITSQRSLTIAIVADLHEFNPDSVLAILREVKPDVIAVPGDLLERHEFGENLERKMITCCPVFCAFSSITLTVWQDYGGDINTTSRRRTAIAS